MRESTGTQWVSLNPFYLYLHFLHGTAHSEPQNIACNNHVGLRQWDYLSLRILQVVFNSEIYEDSKMIWGASLGAQW